MYSCCTIMHRTGMKISTGNSKSIISRSSPISRNVTELDRARQESVAMKAKIRSLELEVDTLRQRLDSLRKAKNTTIIKREREEIMIHPPATAQPIRQRQYRSSISSVTQPDVHHVVDMYHGSGTSSSGSSMRPLSSAAGRPGSSSGHANSSVTASIKCQQDKEMAEKLLKEKDAELERIKAAQVTAEQSFQDRLSLITSEHENKVVKLEERLKEKDEQLENERRHSMEMMTLQFSKDNYEEQLEKLQQEKTMLENQVDGLVSVNVKLKETNLMLQGKCETLLEDLSVKEAQWTEKEDRLHAEIRKQWGDRYHQWITKAEKKMEELQQINVMLQSMMKTKAQNPGL